MEIIRLVVKDTIETRMRKMLAKKHADSDENGEDDDRLVGSIKEDKTEILLEEFDQLFGYDAAKDVKTERKPAAVKPEKKPKEENKKMTTLFVHSN